MFSRNDAPYLRAYAQEAAMVDASELIADALEKSGITQSELAKRLDVSKSEISARLAGERNITVRKLADTLHALGCRLELGKTKNSDRSGQQPQAQVVDFQRYAATVAKRKNSFPHDRPGRPSADELFRVMATQ